MAEEEMKSCSELTLQPVSFEKSFPEKKRDAGSMSDAKAKKTKRDEEEEIETRGGCQQGFTDAEKATFTATDVERLIQDARRAAEDEEGSARPDRAEDSQTWRQEVHQLISAFFADQECEPSYESVGRLLMDLLDVVGEPHHCRPSPKDRKCSILPLPVPEVQDDSACIDGLYSGLVKALNSLYGTGSAARHTRATLRAEKRLRSVTAECPLVGQPLPQGDFKEFFQHRGVDYEGEEVKLARKVTWEGIRASLPAEVASLDIRDFTEGGVRHFIDHFEDYLLPTDLQVIGKAPRTMVDDCEWPSVVKGLTECGLCTILPQSQLHHVGGRPLVNGLFAVTKNEFHGNTELLRLIMNLKPLNENTRSLEGDTATLPAITGLGSVVLDDSEVLVTSSEDIRCFSIYFACHPHGGGI